MGPFGPPVDTQMAPEWPNMTYNHVIYPWKCFRVIWGLSGQHLVRSSFYPSRGLRGTKNFNFAVVNFFDGGQAQTCDIFSGPMSVQNLSFSHGTALLQTVSHVLGER